MLSKIELLRTSDIVIDNNTLEFSYMDLQFKVVRGFIEGFTPRIDVYINGRKYIGNCEPAKGDKVFWQKMESLKYDRKVKQKDKSDKEFFNHLREIGLS